ncbi:MAG TPA: hypothetical protein VN725_07460 [Rhodanobacteraceae bacterium]|nr:hypothetical protein [Rhodanobacteraceae bacterium]
MRWILTALTLLGFLIAFAAHSTGAVAFGVTLTFICGIGAALAFVDVQIQSSARSEYMTPGELEALKTTLKPQASDTPRLPSQQH